MGAQREIRARRGERAFQTWYSGHASRLGLNPNPDDPRHHYDYRSAFESGAEPDSSGHWPSVFKTEGHTRMIVAGENTRTGEPVRKAKPQRRSR